MFISLNCYIYVELHTIYRIKINHIVLELRALVCKPPFSRMTSACAISEIFAGSARVDQALDPATESNLDILEDLTLEKSYHCLDFLRD